MDFNQLYVFINVYENKNFSIAAKNLYLTQPTVSSHITQLEKELNTKLFKRTTKRVSPTEAGETLYVYAKELLERRENILDIFIEKYGKYEYINFGSSTIPTKYILPGFLTSFKKLHPNIKFEQNTGDTFKVLKDIENKKYKIGFVGGKNDNPDIEFIPFYVDYLVFVTPNTVEYLKLIRSKKPIQNLLKCPIILRKNTSGTKKKGDDFLSGLGYTDEELNIVARINDQDEVYKYVSSGYGISLFSKIAANTYRDDGKILIYNPVSFPIRRNLYIAVSKLQQLNSIEKSFVDFVKSNV